MFNPKMSHSHGQAIFQPMKSRNHPMRFQTDESTSRQYGHGLASPQASLLSIKCCLKILAAFYKSDCNCWAKCVGRVADGVTAQDGWTTGRSHSMPQVGKLGKQESAWLALKCSRLYGMLWAFPRAEGMDWLFRPKSRPWNSTVQSAMMKCALVFDEAHAWPNFFKCFLFNY